MTRYATASARSDGLLLLCGGRDANSVVSYLLILLIHKTSAFLCLIFDFPLYRVEFVCAYFLK